MAYAQRLESLKHRHDADEAALHAESLRPAPNEDVVHKLKLHKLWLRDQMTLLSQKMDGDRQQDAR